VVGVVAPRKRWSGDAQLARWVGTRNQEVASDLLSAVELADAPPRPGAPSTALVEALIASTSERLHGVDPEQLLENAEVKSAGRWAVFVVAANVCVIAALPRVVADGWRGLVSPPTSPYDGASISAVPVVGDLDMVLRFPAYSKRRELPLS